MDFASNIDSEENFPPPKTKEKEEKCISNRPILTDNYAIDKSLKLPELHIYEGGSNY